MLEFDYRNVKAEIVGEENGLNLEEAFNNFNAKFYGAQINARGTVHNFFSKSYRKTPLRS